MSTTGASRPATAASCPDTASSEVAAAATAAAADASAADQPGPGAFRRYARVVAAAGRSPLVPAGLLARLPLGAYSIALFFLARSHATSYGFAGRLVADFTVANAIGAVVQGRLLDAFGPRRVLLVAGAVHGSALLAVVPLLRSGNPTAFLLAAVAGSCVPQVSASLRAFWARILPIDARPTAFAMESTIVDTIASSGPLLVSLLLLAGLYAPVLGCALSAGVGTVVFALCRPLRAVPGTGRFSFSLGPLVRPGVAARVGSGALLGCVAGIAEIGAASAMTSAHHARAAGVVIAAFSLGSALAGVWYGARSWSPDAPSRHPQLLLAGMGATALLLALAHHWVAIAPALLVIGALYGPAYIALAVDLSSLSVDNVAELYTFLVTGAIGGQSLGTAIAGYLADAGGPWSVFYLAAAVGVVGALLARMGARGSANAAPEAGIA